MRETVSASSTLGSDDAEVTNVASTEEIAKKIPKDAGTKDKGEVNVAATDSLYDMSEGERHVSLCLFEIFTHNSPIQYSHHCQSETKE